MKGAEALELSKSLANNAEYAAPIGDEDYAPC